MALLIPMPSGISHELEDALSAVQTWAGKQDGNGKWVNAVTDGFGLSGFLRCDGAGNSWTLGPASSHAGTNIRYTLVGNTMTLAVFILNTALTIVSAANTVYVLIPDGYEVATQNTSNVGYMINGAVATTCLIQANPSASVKRFIGFTRINAVLVDDSGGSFTVEGQLTFEVARS